MRSILFLFVTLPFFWMACSPSEEQVSFDPNLEVLFSTDTIAFDTLLSNARSSTRRLIVANPNSEAIIFSSISLAGASDSDYSVVINGKAQDQVVNERILGRDSLLILIEVNIRPQNIDSPYVVRDSIVFNWNGNSADVKLEAWGQDTRTLPSQVICDATWTNERPYIVRDTLVVESGCTLTIEPGTTVFFDNDAALFILGSLHALGDSAAHVVFRNTRMDGVFDEVPGQWSGVWFLEGSRDNEIRYSELFNAQIGLRIGTPDDDTEPDVVVSNTRIFNMSTAGIQAFTSDVQVTNSLIYNCGIYLAGHFVGGNYSYLHCTLSNEPSFFITQEPTVQFTDNILLANNEVLSEDLSFQLVNNIIWGSSPEELLINNGGGRNVEGIISSNIIRSASSLEGNFTSTDFNFPGFANSSEADYSLDSLAFARDMATPTGLERDIDRNLRDERPDIGAFEWLPGKDGEG